MRKASFRESSSCDADGVFGLCRSLSHCDRSKSCAGSARSVRLGDPRAKYEYKSQSSKPSSAGQTTTRHVNACIGSEGRLACDCDQRGWRRYPGSDHAERTAQSHRLRYVNAGGRESGTRHLDGAMRFVLFYPVAVGTMRADATPPATQKPSTPDRNSR